MAMLPKEQELATKLMLLMGDWPKSARQNMVEWVQDALKEARCDGIVAGLTMADQFIAVSRDLESTKSMIKAALLTAKPEQ